MFRKPRQDPAGHEGEARCPLCGGPPTEIIGEGPDLEYATVPGTFRFGLCRPCRHAFLVNPPDRSLLGLLYPPTYYTVNPDSPLRLRGFVLRKKLKMERARVARLIEGRTVRSILELGCGNCQRLFFLHRSLSVPGLRFTGIDHRLTPDVTAQARARGILLLEEDVESPDGMNRQGAPHDLILMTQLLEHCTHPERTLKNLYRILRPGGLVLIDTPGWDAPDRRVFGRRDYGTFQFPRHMNLFSPESLRRFLERCGFQVLDQGYLLSPGSWITSIRNLCGMNSAARTGSILEFVHHSNLPLVACFALFDRIRVALGGKTSNLYILAARP